MSFCDGDLDGASEEIGVRGATGSGPDLACNRDAELVAQQASRLGCGGVLHRIDYHLDDP